MNHESMNKLLVTMLLGLSAFPVCAAAEGGMFGQGRTQFSLMVGNGYAFDNNYFVIGASVSHYVLDGLGVGLSFENWSGGGPGITKYAPFAQYVFYQTSSIQPYVGGERAGINVAAGSNAYISFGFVQEVYLDCQATVYRSCRETYPDLSFTFGF